MAIITSKIEPKIVLPEHEVTMQTTTVSQVKHDLEYKQEYLQTRVHGILAPLLFLNEIVVDINSLIYFTLHWKGHVPTIDFEFADRDNIFGRYAKPGLSNEIQIQIIPDHENTYKKINLLFYVTSISLTSGVITGSASYKVMDFVQTKYESMGEKTTYELFEYIANQTGMGLASNIEATDDKRYIQAREESYKDVIDNAIEESVANQTIVQDYWVDLWNNLILANMYDRYAFYDSEDDMKVWIRGGWPDATENGEKDVPKQIVAVFTNLPSLSGTELGMIGYDQHTNGGGGYVGGTSKATCSYIEATHSWSYSYSADGDVGRDEFLNSEYQGEIYGDYNDIQSRANRETFIKKLNSETLSIYTAHPCLGINRGDQVRVLWYENNDNNIINDNMLQDYNAMISKDDPQLGWIGAMDDFEPNGDINLRVNYQISGQYTVIGIDIVWENNHWDVEYLLTRPARNKIDLINTNK